MTHATYLVDQGPDDFIARQGREAFDLLVSKALPFEPVARVARLVGELDHPEDVLGDPPTMLLLRGESDATRMKVERTLKNAKVTPSALKNAIKSAAAAYDSMTRNERDAPDTPRFVHSGGRTYVVDAKTRSPDELISEFALRFVRQTTVERGEAGREIHLVAHVEFPKGSPMTIEPKGADLKNSGWLFSLLGARAVLTNGPAGYGPFLEASQSLSDPEQIEAYGSTGIVVLKGGARCFVHADGALGADGVTARFDNYLSPYLLPEPTSDRELIRRAVRHALSFLDTASDEVTIPLLGFAFRAPTAGVLPVPCLLFLVGATGTRKTTLIAALMRLFGRDWSHHHFLGFSSTANFLETAMHLAADVVLVIDDFVKSAGNRRHDADELAERVFRSVGNTSSRGRCNADGTTRASLRPRCALVVTGEHAPQGHSINGRILSVPFNSDTVDLTKLPAWSGEADLPSIAMSAFISEFLLPRYDEIAATLKSQIEHHRNTTFVSCSAHARTPENLANVYCGFLLFVIFAYAVEAIDATEVEALRARAVTALLTLGEGQREYVEEVNPCRLFIEVLASLIAQGAVVVAHGKVAGVDADLGSLHGSKPVIGWTTGGGVVAINESAAIAHVNAELQRSGKAPIPNGAELRKALIAKQFALPGQASRGGRSQFTTPGGVRVNVLRIPPGVLFGTGAPACGAAEPNDESGQKEVSDGN